MRRENQNSPRKRILTDLRKSKIAKFQSLLIECLLWKLHGQRFAYTKDPADRNFSDSRLFRFILLLYASCSTKWITSRKEWRDWELFNKHDVYVPFWQLLESLTPFARNTDVWEANKWQVEHLKLQVRMNIKSKCVELRTFKSTTDPGALQKGEGEILIIFEIILKLISSRLFACIHFGIRCGWVSVSLPQN